MALNKERGGVKPIIGEFLVGALSFFFLINLLIDVVGIEAFVIWIWIFAALLNLQDREGEDADKDQISEPSLRVAE